MLGRRRFRGFPEAPFSRAHEMHLRAYDEEVRLRDFADEGHFEHLL
ncbi:hypothetical protein A2U01_0071041, partial [Trifolium medium]|nr:hypothetical protein [Trifolium medium]